MEQKWKELEAMVGEHARPDRVVRLRRMRDDPEALFGVVDQGRWGSQAGKFFALKTRVEGS